MIHFRSYSYPTIDDFRVAFRLCFKASPDAKPFIWKLVLFTCKWTKIYQINQKGLALGLALKQRRKATRKSPVGRQKPRDQAGECTHWVTIFIKYNTNIYTSSSFFDRNGFLKQWRPSILDSLHQNLRATNTVYVSCTRTTPTWVSRTHPHSLDHFLTSVVAMQGETEGKSPVRTRARFYLSLYLVLRDWYTV